tara:strand:+ start:90 stop:425 length:336 start_codon:yes stop_codon:yes gene_type:complete
MGDRRDYHREYNKNRRVITQGYIDYKKEYQGTYNCNKADSISRWKRRGVKETKQYTYEELFETYYNWGYCELCDVKLTTGKRTPQSKCLDHDHETGEFRMILCHICNCKKR